MYVQLDKEKLGIGNIIVLNLAAVKSTTVQISDCRVWVLNKLRHSLLHNPALRGNCVYKNQMSGYILLIVYCIYIHSTKNLRGWKINLKWSKVL
jgi:hypothetical protein